MNLVEKQFTGTIVPQQCNRSVVAAEHVEAIETYLGLFETRRTKDACDPILSFVSENIGLNLTFKKADFNYIVATADNGDEYIIIGNWHSNGYQYILKSCLKRKRRFESVTWQLNGQEGNGTKQIAFYGEETQIIIPQFKTIVDDYMVAMGYR